MLRSGNLVLCGPENIDGGGNVVFESAPAAE